MWKKLISVLVIVRVLMPRLGYRQDAKAVLEGVAKAMGDVKTVQYTGSGSTYAVGQSPVPGCHGRVLTLKALPGRSIMTRCRCGTRLSGRRVIIPPAVAAGNPRWASSARSCPSAAPMPGTRWGDYHTKLGPCRP